MNSMMVEWDRSFVYSAQTFILLTLFSMLEAFPIRCWKSSSLFLLHYGSILLT